MFGDPAGVGMDKNGGRCNSAMTRYCRIRQEESNPAWLFFCLDVIWNVILKRGQNRSHKNGPSRSGFSSSRAFRTWSWICHSSFGLLVNQLLVCVYWGSNPAVPKMATASNLVSNFEEEPTRIGMLPLLTSHPTKKHEKTG